MADAPPTPDQDPPLRRMARRCVAARRAATLRVLMAESSAAGSRSAEAQAWALLASRDSDVATLTAALAQSQAELTAARVQIHQMRD